VPDGFGRGHGLLQYARGFARLVDAVQHRAEQEQGLGLQRWRAGLSNDLQHIARFLCVLDLPDHARPQSSNRFAGNAVRFGCAGEAAIPCLGAKQAIVVTVAHLRQLDHHVRRRVEQRGTIFNEHPDRCFELDPTIVETTPARGESLAAGVIGEPAAGLTTGEVPGITIRIETLRRELDDVRSAPRCGLLHRGSDGIPTLLVPDRIQLGSSVGTGIRRRAGLDGVRGQRRKANRSGPCEGRRDTPATATRRLLDLGDHLRHRSEPRRWLGGQPSTKCQLDATRNHDRARWRPNVAATHRCFQQRDRVARERPGFEQRLPQRHAPRKEIRSSVGGPALELLRSHVRGRAQNAPRARNRDVQVRIAVDGFRFALRLAEGARKPEVHHPRAAIVANHHVLGLEVAVNEPGLVRGMQAARRLHVHLDDALW